MARYLANSAAQSAAESGGTTPVTGSQSVIDRPERVSRVNPPITTIRKIIAQHTRSQAATALVPRAWTSTSACAALADTIIAALKRSRPGLHSIARERCPLARRFAAASACLQGFHHDETALRVARPDKRAGCVVTRGERGSGRTDSGARQQRQRDDRADAQADNARRRQHRRARPGQGAEPAAAGPVLPPLFQRAAGAADAGA